MSPTPTTAQVANRVTAVRIAKGMTVKGLAETSGVPRSTLQRHLDGHSSFKIDQLEKVAVALGVPLSELIPGEAA